MTNRLNQNPSKALTFFLSLLPGAGHMYLGLMKRGLELMIAFFSAIFIVSDLLQLAEIGVPLCLIIFFYGLFDAQHLMKAIKRGESVTDEHHVQFLSKVKLNGYHMGIVAIVLGVIFLLDRLRGYLSMFIPSAAYHMIERSLVPLLIIALGLFLIKKASSDENLLAGKD